MLHLSAFLVRKFGTPDCEVIAAGAHFNADNAPCHQRVIELEAQLVSNTPTGAAMREEYEQVLVIVKNQIRSKYRFQAPAIAARQLANQRLQDAERLKAHTDAMIRSALEPAEALKKLQEDSAAAALAIETAREHLDSLPPPRAAASAAPVDERIAQDARAREETAAAIAKNAAASSPAAIAANAAALPVSSAAALPPAPPSPHVQTQAEKAAREDVEKEAAKDRLKQEREAAAVNPAN